ncbi:PREDICTED: F-box/LRR-repeat protein At2g43260-like [Camelina sativa]|uniref:F-box/LRR-repeat protein At2g43260-like n=1 Tax=Camelina sativa TaxID=90675 RepID=A0ABM0ZCC7_CAMSA|nr:PREDICTED: F-box/LRR-repeat protein At2g43260-like [Camelina sativa]
MKTSLRRRKTLLAFGCKDDGDDSPPFLVPEEDEDKEEEICYIGNCDASRISLTCDGLICIPGSDSIQVCNPATRVSRRFPTGECLVSTRILLHGVTGRIPATSLLHRQRYLDHEHVPKFPTTRSSFGFGKDEVTGEYKVVELRGHPRASLIVGNAMFLIFKPGGGDTSTSFLIGFLSRKDPFMSMVPSTEFRVVSHPNPIYTSDDGGTPYFSELIVLRDRLSVSEMRITNVPHPRLDIWSMVDAVKEGWVKMHSFCLCQLYKSRSSEIRLFTPLAILDDQGDGGVLIVWDYQESLFMSYPKNFLLNKVSAYARVVASSYFQTLVPVP